MSNNMTSAFQAIFNPIIGSRADVYPFHCLIVEGNVKNFFSKIEFVNNDYGLIFHGYSYAYLKYEDNHYVAIINIDINDSIIFDPEIIKVFDNKDEKLVSFFVFLASNGLIKAKNETLSSLYEEALCTIEDDDCFDYYNANGGNKIRKHDFRNIESYFQSFYIFEIKEDSLLFNQKNCYKVLIYLLVKQKKLITLPFTDSSLYIFERLVLEGKENIPFEFVLEALIAIKWKYSYKDLYRCIENLYGIKKIIGFIENLECNEKNPQEVKVQLENELGWRPNEQNSLIEIINTVDIDTIKKIGDIFSIDHESNIREKVAIKLYKIRNVLVHHREALSISIDIPTKDDYWDIIVQAMLEIILEIYNS